MNGVTCAIDANDYDQDVVDLAADFAKRFDVDLDLIHVTLFPDPTNAAWPAYVGSPNEMIRNHECLKKVETSVAGVDLRFHHLSGIPAEKILEFVEAHEPRLLVLGTHGRQGLERLLGSVAMRILRRAPCPVMILRQRNNCPNPVDRPPTSKPKINS